MDPWNAISDIDIKTMFVYIDIPVVASLQIYNSMSIHYDPFVDIFHF